MSGTGPEILTEESYEALGRRVRRLEERWKTTGHKLSLLAAGIAREAARHAMFRASAGRREQELIDKIRAFEGGDAGRKADELTQRLEEARRENARLRELEQRGRERFERRLEELTAAEQKACAASRELEQRLQRTEKAHGARQASASRERKRLAEALVHLKLNAESGTGLLEAAQREIEKHRLAFRKVKDKEAQTAQEYERRLGRLREESKKTSAELSRVKTEVAEERHLHARTREQAESRQRELEAEVDLLRTAASVPREPDSTREDGAQEAPGWRMRTEDGAVYGPVSLPELRSWAADCRIVPGTSVSEDGRAWGPAESVPELGMHWMVTLVDGSAFGPINMLGVRHLVDDAAVDADAPVRHVTTGEAWPAARLLSPELAGVLRERDALVAELAGMGERLRARDADGSVAARAARGRGDGEAAGIPPKVIVARIETLAFSGRQGNRDPGQGEEKLSHAGI